MNLSISERPDQFSMGPSLVSLLFQIREQKRLGLAHKYRYTQTDDAARKGGYVQSWKETQEKKHQLKVCYRDTWVVGEWERERNGREQEKQRRRERERKRAEDKAIERERRFREYKMERNRQQHLERERREKKDSKVLDENSPNISSPLHSSTTIVTNEKATNPPARPSKPPPNLDSTKQGS